MKSSLPEDEPIWNHYKDDATDRNNCDDQEEFWRSEITHRELLSQQ
jgi:hypothetical protein